jgi:antirestriction protein ArdC
MPSATEKRREELAERVARSLEAGVIPWQRGYHSIFKASQIPELYS